MKIRSLILTGLALAASACALPKAETIARLGTDPVLGGGRYTSGGGLTVATDLRESDGMTMVCGVWAMSHQQSALTKLAEHQVLNTGSVYRGRERIVSGLLFMRQVDPAPSYAGREAHCYRTDRVWRAPNSAGPVTLFFPRQVVADESSGGFGSHFIWFLPGDPGAGES